MADNAYRSDPGSGELIRTVDKSGVEAQVVILDLGGSGAESLLGDGGQLPAAPLPVSSSTNVSLASSASSAMVVNSNTSRHGLIVTNTDANDCYLYYGTTATTSQFTVKIPSDSLWEMPQPIYTGRIDAIWAANGSGSLIGSEL